MAPKYTQTIYAAIDPGLSGGIGAIFPDGSCFVRNTPVLTTRTKYARAKTKSGKTKYSVKRTYVAKKMLAVLQQLKRVAAESSCNLAVGIEFQSARPGDGKPQLMALGTGYGRWLQTLEILFERDYVLIVPGVWKPRYLNTGAPKLDSVVLARKLFPGVPLKNNEDGKAEALLMADYLRRRASGESYPRMTTVGSSKPARKKVRPKRKAKLFR